MVYSQVDSQIVLGSCILDVKSLDELQRHFPITAVLNLQTDEDMTSCGIDWPVLEAAYLAREIHVVRVPIRDFDRQSLCENLPKAVTELTQLLQTHQKVYVHCTGGVGRSPSVVTAYFHWIRGMRLEEARRLVCESHVPASPDLEAIRLADIDRNQQISK